MKQCSHCNKNKKSKNIAVRIINAKEKLCNGCYGELLSKNLIQRGC